MKTLRRVGLLLRRHKRGEEEAAFVVNVGWLGVRLAGAIGLGASLASAAILAPGMVDLSNNNGTGAAVAIAAPGVRVVEAKATEGVKFRDGLYGTFRTTAAARHRAFGGYLFLHPTEGGAAQADYFLAYAHPRRGDIQPVVDSETGPPAAAAAATYAALRELVRRGFEPLLYASSSYVAGLVAADARLKQFRVWQAEYGPTLHLVPGVRVVAWQFTDRAHVGGIAVDGSHLLVRNVAVIEWKPKPRTPAQKKRAAKAAVEVKLRARTGYWSWLPWYLGEGAWKRYGTHAATVRPSVSRHVPAAWWRRERVFVRARHA